MSYDGWRYLSEVELKKYDEYPTLVKTILKMDQKDIEELRADTEKIIREWLDETDQSDPAVQIIKSNLEIQTKVIIKGETPLTEMALTAYSEIIAYSRLLQKNPKAKPEQISSKSVNEIKKQVKKVWKSFSSTDQKDIATSPGVWVCLRAQLKYSSKEEQDKIRDNLKNLESVTRNIESNNSSNTETDSSTKTGTVQPMDMTTHWCMMQIQQQTFNSYMWTHGYSSYYY